MDRNEAISNVIEEYEKLRADNARRRDYLVYEVYEKLPEIKEIDKKIAETGSNTLKEILGNPDKKGLKEEMHKKFEILKQRKKEILLKNNIPLDFDKIHYRCEVCKDTGYVEGIGKCTCFNQRVIDHMYQQSGMGEMFKTQCFENFDISLYSKNPFKDMKNSPYENMVNIKKYCEKYVSDFDNMEKSLCFCGGTGLGKTFMSCCIAKALIEKDKTVLYMRAEKMFRLFDDEKFGRKTSQTDSIYDCDLLIIDDLGTETESKFNSSYLLELINERVMKNKKIIISTNLNFNGIEKKYTKRLTSRITESFMLLYFYGDDIRVKLMGK